MKDGTVRFLRVAAITAGSLLILTAVLSDLLGLSAGSLSRNQIGFFLAGTALVVASMLGRRFIRVYRGTALLILNVIMAMIFLELVTVALLKILDPEAYRIHRMKMERGNLELLEANVAHGMYAPFVVWRSDPALNMDSVTITEDGYRITPGASSDPDAYKVFLLGGSAMWGVNVSDVNTIGSFLQRDLAGVSSRPVAVFNLAQVAHSSTQEVIELVLQLRGGNILDAVIFYDGFNEVECAYEEGHAGGHYFEDLIAARVEGRPEAFSVLPPLEALLRASNTYILVSALEDRINRRDDLVRDLETYSTMGIDPDSLAVEIVDTYIGNYRVVSALAESYGFEYLMVWQPSVWFGDKQLTDYEQEIYHGGFEFFLSGDDPAFKELYELTYNLFEEQTADSVNLASYARVFDDCQETVYNDYSGVHVEPWTNELVASLLAEELLGRGIPCLIDGTSATGAEDSDRISSDEE